MRSRYRRRLAGAVELPDDLQVLTTGSRDPSRRSAACVRIW